MEDLNVKIISIGYRDRVLIKLQDGRSESGIVTGFKQGGPYGDHVYPIVTLPKWEQVVLDGVAGRIIRNLTIESHQKDRTQNG